MSDNNNEKFDLNMHTFRLLQQEPFFASYQDVSTKHHLSTFQLPVFVSIHNQLSLKCFTIQTSWQVLQTSKSLVFLCTSSTTSSLSMSPHDFLLRVCLSSGTLQQTSQSIVTYADMLPEGGCIPSRLEHRLKTILLVCLLRLI